MGARAWWCLDLGQRDGAARGIDPGAVQGAITDAVPRARVVRPRRVNVSAGEIRPSGRWRTDGGARWAQLARPICPGSAKDSPMTDDSRLQTENATERGARGPMGVAGASNDVTIAH